MSQATPWLTDQPSETRAWQDLYTPTSSARPRRRPPAQRRAQWQAARAEAEGLIAAFATLEQRLSGRLRLLSLVHAAAGWEPARREAAIASLSPNNASLAQAILARIDEAPGLAGRIQQALDRFEAATQAARAAERTLQPAEGPVSFLDLPALKGRLYSLSTLDLLFTGEPVLGRMFPPVERQAGVRELPVPAEPAPAPPAPVAEPVRSFGLVASLKRMLDELEAREQA